MAEPEPGEPDYWLPRPESAFWTNGGVLGSKRGWTVENTPPPPWPNFDGPISRAVYGPAGTRWRFASDDLLAVLDVGWEDVLTQVVQFALKFLKIKVFLPGTIVEWTVPGPREVEFMAVQVVRTSIHANLQGTEEELVHVLHWLPSGSSIVDVVPFTTLVMEAWADFVTSVSGLFYTGTVYDYVAGAVITFAPPADPDYAVTTEYVNFEAGVDGTGTESLPNEVAMCVSHSTARRGARYRGRTYLGGLSKASTQANGRFTDAFILAVRDAWVDFVTTPAITDIADFVVLSPTYGTAELVTNERVGNVPDSMRSRRRSQEEVYVAAPLVP